jgi:methylglyoxal synthase
VERYVSLVAHNDMKPTMMRFVAKHLEFFRERQIITTGSTGKALEEKLGLEVACKV